MSLPYQTSANKRRLTMYITEAARNRILKDTRPFCYYGDEATEIIERYKPGGYHPVHLGDMFPSDDNPRYRVLHKLGKGGSATVWLARDRKENRWVALKFNVAHLTGQNQEIAILKSFSNQPSEHPGANHIIKLLDSFEIDGPNGTHEVIVTDVCASFYSLRFARILDKYQRIACYQLLQGLAFMQCHSIIHGDLHFGNAGCKIPRINIFTEAELLHILPEPSTVPVVPKDPSMQTDSLPKYIVESILIADVWPEVITEDPNFQFVTEILDFGNAVTLQGKSIDTFPQMPCTIRPPELTLNTLSGGKIKAKWTMASDIWSLACLIYETTYGTAFFYFPRSDEHHISQITQYLGPLPDRWRSIWDVKHRKDDAENGVADPNYQWEQKCTRRNRDMRLVVDLVKSMMRYEPVDRPLPTDLLNHPWFTCSDIKHA